MGRTRVNSATKSINTGMKTPLFEQKQKAEEKKLFAKININFPLRPAVVLAFNCSWACHYLPSGPGSGEQAYPIPFCWHALFAYRKKKVESASNHCSFASLPVWSWEKGRRAPFAHCFGLCRERSSAFFIWPTKWNWSYCRVIFVQCLSINVFCPSICWQGCITFLPQTAGYYISKMFSLLIMNVLLCSGYLGLRYCGRYFSGFFRRKASFFMAVSIEYLLIISLKGIIPESSTTNRPIVLFSFGLHKMGILICSWILPN